MKSTLTKSSVPEAQEGGLYTERVRTVTCYYGFPIFLMRSLAKLDIQPTHFVSLEPYTIVGTGKRDRELGLVLKYITMRQTDRHTYQTFVADLTFELQ